MGTFIELRDEERHRVFGGNAEVCAWRAQGFEPLPDRGRVVNWSRGGVLIRVSNPHKKMLFFKQEPYLVGGERVSLILRFPPAYRDICIEGRVAHARRPRKTPDTLWVGVEFNEESAAYADATRDMISLLEPTSRSGRVPRQRSA